MLKYFEKLMMRDAWKASCQKGIAFLTAILWYWIQLVYFGILPSGFNFSCWSCCWGGWWEDHHQGCGPLSTCREPREQRNTSCCWFGGVLKLQVLYIFPLMLEWILSAYNSGSFSICNQISGQECVWIMHSSVAFEKGIFHLKNCLLFGKSN